MKWRSLCVLFCLFLAGLFSGCGGGNQTGGMTPVTVTVGGGRTAPKAISRAALLSKATPTVASITFTIKGPGMDDVVRVVPISPPQTITEVFYLLNGPDRTFLIEATDGANTIIYSGSMMANLDGTPVTVALPLQYMLFNRLIWSPWNDETTAVARDGNGNLIIVGHTYGDLEGNVNADPTHGTFDVFVTKVSQTGARIWTRQFGTAGDDLCYSVVTNSSGEIYLAGSTAGDLNGNVLSGPGSIDAFVSKLSPTGAFLWTRTTGSAGTITWGNSLTVDSAGNAYITGDTEGSLGAANAGLFDVFVTKLSPTGRPLWTRQAGTPEADFSEGIALNAAGTRVVITGSTRGNLAGVNPGTGTTDAYIMTFDALTSTPSWSVQFGTTADDDAWAVAIDGAGNVYVAGETSGNLGGPGAGLSDLFVASYSPAGAFRWNRQLGTAGNDVANAITVDPIAGVVVTGKTSGDLQGAGSDGFDDALVLSLSPANGTLLWAPLPNPVRQYGTRANDDGVGVVTDGSGNIWVVGNTFGGFTSSATEDIFVLQYNAAGTKLP